MLKWIIGGLVAVGAVGGLIWWEEKRTANAPSSEADLSLSGVGGLPSSYTWQPPSGGSATAATSSATSIATASVSGGGVLITAAGAGPAQVTITWTDSSGNTQTSNVTVVVVA